MNVLQNAARTPEGVTVNGVVLTPIVDKCEGCDRVREFEAEKFCSSYPVPERKWAEGRCNFATHTKADAKTATRINPLKASKRAAKGR